MAGGRSLEQMIQCPFTPRHPEGVYTAPSPAGRVVKLVAGARHMAALTADGKVGFGTERAAALFAGRSLPEPVRMDARAFDKIRAAEIKPCFVVP